MILESAQLLCTSLWVAGIPTRYKPSHQKHPCALWLNKSWSHKLWLVEHARALCREYTYRYERRHASEAVIDECDDLIQPFRGYDGDAPMLPFAQAMPDEYKVPGNAVAAYRTYFIYNKQHLKKYTWRSVPKWWGDTERFVIQLGGELQ